MGSPRRAVVERASECKRCKASLQKGTKCFEIPQLRSPFAGAKKYCDDCFAGILTKTQEDLEALKEL